MAERVCGHLYIARERLGEPEVQEARSLLNGSLSEKGYSELYFSEDDQSLCAPSKDEMNHLQFHFFGSSTQYKGIDKLREAFGKNLVDQVSQ